MAACLILLTTDEWEELQPYTMGFNGYFSLLRWPQDADLLSSYEQWWVCVPDSSVKQILDLAQMHQVEIVLLPHAENPQVQRGYCVPSSLGEVVWDSEQRCLTECDVVRCNGTVVLNKVVIGNAFTFQPGGHKSTLSQRLHQTWDTLTQFGRREHQPRRFSITLDGDIRLDTAALGITCTPHVLTSNLGKSLLPDPLANDGQFYALVVSPKSLLEVVSYLMSQTWQKNVSQPGFLGVLRSHQVEIAGADEFAYQIDGQSAQGDGLKLHVDRQKVRLLAEPGSPLLNAERRENSIRRIQHLPQSREAVQALVSKDLPWISHAADEDFKELYQQIRENSRVSSAFLVMMVLSTLLATLGLYADSAPVIIGAMILAPLMAPIISLSMSFARQDEKLLVSSAQTLAIGWLVATGFAVLLSWILPMRIETHEISARLSPTLLDLGVAIISGIAGAYAHARSEVAKSLAGVAIAVALVPPLAVSGIGIGWMSLHITTGALLLFGANLAGIVFAAAITFLLLGFAPFARARRGLVVSLLAVLLVSIPLGMSFYHLAQEAKMIAMIESIQINAASIRQVKVDSSAEPYYISLELVSARPLELVDLKALKGDVELSIGKPVVLQIKPVLQY